MKRADVRTASFSHLI